MSVLNFVIPNQFEDLTRHDGENYFVREIVNVDDLPEKLRDARTCFKEEGAQYILDYFDVYYSVIHHKSFLDNEKLLLVINQLETGISTLIQNLKFLLDDPESITPEVKLKYQTLIKMFLYLFCNLITTMDNKNSSRDLQVVLKKRSKKKSLVDVDDEDSFNKNSALVKINMLLQCDLHLFWDPPVVEEQIINMVAEVCYPSLENNSISSNKELQHEIFNVFGILIKTYSYDESFLIRLVQLLKVNAHLVKVIADGINQLVKNFSAKSLISEFIQEVMEVLMDERQEDAEGTKYCTSTLVELSKLQPELMIPEIAYLNHYLGHDSATLRIAVLTVMSEVLIILSAKLEQNDDEKALIGFILNALKLHINDVAVSVRSKIIQTWAKIQKENLIGVEFQNDILREIVVHICDKGTSARKNAATTVTSFLEHNPYASELSLKNLQLDYDVRLNDFRQTEENIKKSLSPEEGARFNEEWNAIVAEISNVTKKETPKKKGKSKNKKDDENDENIETDESNDENDQQEENSQENVEEMSTDQQDQSNTIPADQLITIIEVYLAGKRYKDAILLCKRLIKEVPQYIKMREREPETSEDQFLLQVLKTLHSNMELQRLIDQDTINKMNQLEKSVKHIENAVEFAKLLEEAMPKMKELLTSVNVTEMQEAVKFFVTAYQFKLDGSELKVLELLEVMKLPYDERKVIVIDALVEVFLVTTVSKNMKEHVKEIVERLIRFTRIVTYDYRHSFQTMIAEWTTKGKLDNAVLDMLFSYFTKKEDVDDDKSLAALQVLTLAAHGRKSIVMNNLKMICDVVFQDRGINDMLLVAETCKFLSVAGLREQKVDDDQPPYRLSYVEPVWTQLSNILVENFSKPVKFYCVALSKAILMIYKLCSKPELITQNLIMSIMKLGIWSSPGSVAKMPIFYINRLNVLLGDVALYETAHLDDTVYIEIKRRAHKKASDGNKKGKGHLQTSSARKRANKSIASEEPDESILEGAQAEDEDAQFVLNILEYKIVTNCDSLGAFTPFFLEVCQNLNKFPNEQVQCGSVLVLLRYMLMSNIMCRQYVDLVFRILATTQSGNLKRLIIINFADLLARFPNTIEPYSAQIYDKLSDPDTSVQKTTYFILANLLTRNMLRVNKKIYVMALPIVPEHTGLSDLGKTFFTQLAKNKQPELTNILPDLFSFLCSRREVSEEQLQHIMKFLFGLIDKNKLMEGLVDRFCAKLINNEEGHVLANVGFCLHLIQYNEKSASKLVEQFPNYKDALHNTELYSFFKQIMINWTKTSKYNLKDIAAELDGRIVDFFKIRDPGDEQSTPPPNRTPRNYQKKTVKKRKVAKRSS